MNIIKNNLQNLLIKDLLQFNLQQNKFNYENPDFNPILCS